MRRGMERFPEALLAIMGEAFRDSEVGTFFDKIFEKHLELRIFLCTQCFILCDRI